MDICELNQTLNHLDNVWNEEEMCFYNPISDDSGYMTSPNTSPFSQKNFDNTDNILDGILKCFDCDRHILDKTLVQVKNKFWHQGCMKCTECSMTLEGNCFINDGQLFCKAHKERSSGVECFKCNEDISLVENIRRNGNNVYHVQCFCCCICNSLLNTGDGYYTTKDNQIVCSRNHDMLSGSENNENEEKRCRSVISGSVLETLENVYRQTNKPSRHIREELSRQTGLEVRVVQVWFQNKRAKEKRMKQRQNRRRNIYSNFYNYKYYNN